ncbi:unnamed protein product [Phaedon cochleariae]|uniref:Insulin receptor substrate 1 n=1 Tax=Phaedon cochleariae TaxID=80249 RepID=A0A9P0DFK6_PHACE|nr:unnamed protein product [Phaedon cochleariae]
MSARNEGAISRGGEVLRCGLLKILKKLKTSRKKWFVLRAETAESSARLEYYDSEKKFHNGQAAKRSIQLKTCFNINKRHDTKHKHVIALYTKDDCFCVVLDSEEELESWLKTLLSLQHGEEAADGETPRPTFEHVWQVVVLNRGLGTGRTGNYRLCLTDKTLSLIKKDDTNCVIHLQLTNIRSCGSLKNYFFLEIGRSSLLGAGEVWMESEDTNIAQNIHTTIFHAMSTNSKHDEMRVRSSSATESSKPNNTYKKQFPKPAYFTHGRERCDSMPSRPRAVSEGTHPAPGGRSYPAQARSHHPPSPPSAAAHSPLSAACSTTDSSTGGSSYSLAADEADGGGAGGGGVGEFEVRYPVPLTPDEAIAEEDCPESPPCGMHGMYVPMRPHSSSDDGYVDMSPRSRPLWLHSAAVVSGTPSTDVRFSDYPLDKVASYLAGDHDASRPTRAYSVGSRPEGHVPVGGRRVEAAGGLTPEEARGRSFSTGSKAKRGPSRVLPHHQHVGGGKSSSAPILLNSRNHSCHGSNDPMNNHMFMDFSGGSNNTLNNNSPKTPSGYVEMKPGVEIASRKPSEISSSYMDMSGSAPSINTHGEYHSFVDISRQYKLPAHTNNNYVDMDKGKNKPKPSTSPCWHHDYLDMSANQTRRSDRGSSFGSQASAASSPRNGDYMPASFSQQEAVKTPEGYVEMTLGGRHNRQGSLDGAQTTSTGSADYLDMSGGTSSTKRKPSSSREKVCSQPISIQSAGGSGGKSASSPVSFSSLLGRKASTGTPPKMHLPLASWAAPYSSLPRQRTRKDSKDSSGSSVGTPSTSGAIFPMSLNSPSSPMRPVKVEMSSTPSALKIPAAILNAIYKNNNKSNIASNAGGGGGGGDDYASMDFEVKKGKENNLAKEFDGQKKAAKKHADYVNYAPAAPSPAPPTPTEGDYAPMRPGAVPTRSLGHLSLAADARVGQPEAGGGPMEEGALGGGMVAVGEQKDAAHSCISSTSRDETPPHSSTNECVSPAAKISRPNSANDDTITKTSSSSSTNKTSPSIAVEIPKVPTQVVGRGVTSCELWASTPSLAADSDRQSQLQPQPGKLHYASLDLPQAMEEDEACSPRACPRRGSPGGSETAAAPSGEQAFLYAEIDFMKSEGLRQNTNNSQSLLHNAKVKH